MVLAAKDKIRKLAGIVLMGLLLATAACKEDNKLGKANINPKKLPTLSTRNVATVISDSGFTKYKVVTPLWNVYNEAEVPYWDFPEGVYLRQLDHDLKVVSTVAADSAVYVPSKKIWELYGSVEIDQKDKAYFFTPRIFFDDRNKRIYSDTFIHIKTPTQILEGVGFESNQEMTNYRVLKPMGMFPASFSEGVDGGMGIPQGMGPVAIPSMDPAGDPFEESDGETEEETVGNQE